MDRIVIKYLNFSIRSLSVCAGHENPLKTVPDTKENKYFNFVEFQKFSRFVCMDNYLFMNTRLLFEKINRVTIL